MKRFLAGLIALVLALIAPAGMAGEGADAKAGAGIAKYRAERDAQIKKFAGRRAFTIGLFPGYTRPNSTDDLLDRYTALMLYLTSQVGEPFLFVPLKTKQEALDAGSAEAFSLYLLNPEQSVFALQFLPDELIPVIQQSEGIRPGVVVLRESGIKSLADLRGKKVGAIISANVTSLFRYAAKTEGVDVALTNVDGLPQTKLSDLLRGKSFDAVVMRDTFMAEQTCVKKGECVSFALDAKYGVTGFVLLANKERVSADIRAKIASALTALDPEHNPDHFVIASGLDVSDPKHLRFLPAQSSQLDLMRTISKTIK